MIPAPLRVSIVAVGETESAVRWQCGGKGAKPRRACFVPGNYTQEGRARDQIRLFDDWRPKISWEKERNTRFNALAGVDISGLGRASAQSEDLTLPGAQLGDIDEQRTRSARVAESGFRNMSRQWRAI